MMTVQCMAPHYYVLGTFAHPGNTLLFYYVFNSITGFSVPAHWHWLLENDVARNSSYLPSAVAAELLPLLSTTI